MSWGAWISSPANRQRLAHVPLSQGRPVWVDDPHFNPGYHLRHTALPSPGGDEQLKRLAGRLFAQQLDRTKPLWEIWLVDGLAGGRFALIGKTHHALVDGVSGVDITTVLFDTAPDGVPAARAAQSWTARPLPSSAQLLGRALLERATVPGEVARGARALTRAPRQVLGGVRDRLVGLGAMAWAGVNGAPDSPFNVPIGPHRRYTWVDADLDRFRAIKTALGGTVNDAILTAVAGGLGRYLRSQGHNTEDLVLKAMVPVSVRAASSAEPWVTGWRPCTHRCPWTSTARGRALRRSTPRCQGSRSPVRRWAPRCSPSWRGSPPRPSSARRRDCSRASASST